MTGPFLYYLNSAVGWLEISADADYVRSISFVQGKGTTSENSSPALKLCIRQLQEYFEGRRKDFDLPLQQPGTAFQNSVWSELQNIPFGKTISYLQLAKNLGNAKTIRAAGTANGRNKIAIVVPCHRVIGSNGTLVGYAGGLDKKKLLLDHEARISGQQSLSLH